MSKFIRKSLWLLCCFLLTIVPSYAFAQSADALGTNNFTGSTFVPDQVTFDMTGSMNSARYRQTATLLNDGRVLVAGGNDDKVYQTPLASAELYDPDKGTWSITGSLNVPRYYHSATLLNDGWVLVTGGLNESLSPSFLVNSELYDPGMGTWSTTGSMNVPRAGHTATLLKDGRVLVAGGINESPSGTTSELLDSAELYDPVKGTWSTTSSMNVPRSGHTATLLKDGRVLVAGGSGGSYSISSAELYDPVKGTWSTTGSMNYERDAHTATLLNNGKVLVAGGDLANGSPPPYGYIYSTSSAELYDPDTGTWFITGNMYVGRVFHTATLLNDGWVLVAGGYYQSPSPSYLDSAELYDPVHGAWNIAGGFNFCRRFHTATLLNTGKVLLAGGYCWGSLLASAGLVGLIPNNTLTGTLTLPSGWLNSTVISAQFVGSTSAAEINAGALSNDNNNWGSWIAVTSDVPTTTSWNMSGEGKNMTVYLRLRDVNDQVATVVTGMVNVDFTKPTSSMTPLPPFVVSTAIPLVWSGLDELSGVATYDVQMRAGLSGIWTDILSNTTNTSTNFTGTNGITYYFRARARDMAGNVEDWPPDYDTSTVVRIPTRIFLQLTLQ